MAGTGGRRPGAGRKPGSKMVLTRADAERIRGSTEETPLDVMAGTMRELWRMARYEDEKFTVLRPHLEISIAERACAIAKDLAPYLHPRLSSIDPETGKPPEQAINVDLLVIARQVAITLHQADRKMIARD